MGIFFLCQKYQANMLVSFDFQSTCSSGYALELGPQFSMAAPCFACLLAYYFIVVSSNHSFVVGRIILESARSLAVWLEAPILLSFLVHNIPQRSNHAELTPERTYPLSECFSTLLSILHACGFFNCHHPISRTRKKDGKNDKEWRRWGFHFFLILIHPLFLVHRPQNTRKLNSFLSSPT